LRYSRKIYGPTKILIMQKNYLYDAKQTIDLEIKALKKLKKTINNSFVKAVKAIVACKSKVILCGVGKSGIIASKISATLSSVGTPSFSLNANDCSHGDMGAITKEDVLILISNSGKSAELNNIIKYANRNNVLLISITSNKHSILYKSSNIKILIPQVEEAGLSIVPTSSTAIQLCLGDALAVATMNKKKINQKDFKKYHPSGNLGFKLKTVEDVMLKSNKIPFISEDANMEKALEQMTKKKLGTLIAINKKKITTGIITDGQIRRKTNQAGILLNKKVKDIMTKKPISISKDSLTVKALALMNSKKITSLLVHNNKFKNKTIGILHIHNIIENSVN